MSSVAFAEAARSLGAATRRLGFDAPAFRSPPRRPGIGRTIRRRSDGSCIVSVRIADRPLAATIADMIDGIIVANTPVANTPVANTPARNTPPHAASIVELRDHLWAAASHLLAGEASDAGAIDLTHRLAA